MSATCIPWYKQAATAVQHLAGTCKSLLHQKECAVSRFVQHWTAPIKNRTLITLLPLPLYPMGKSAKQLLCVAFRSHCNLAQNPQQHMTADKVTTVISVTTGNY